MSGFNCSRIGYFSKPHGIEGNLVLRLNGNFADEIEPGEPLFIEIDDTLVPFFIEEITPLEEKAIVKIEFVNTLEDAEKLASKQVCYALNLNEYSENLADLYVSFHFYDTTSDISGIITAYISNPVNPCFALDIYGQEAIIPASKDFIKSVDSKKRLVEFELPEGILDLD
jgi:16S rRNA processing protein RimM